jgi:hypothetical protein
MAFKAFGRCLLLGSMAWGTALVGGCGDESHATADSDPADAQAGDEGSAGTSEDAGAEQGAGRDINVVVSPPMTPPEVPALVNAAGLRCESVMLISQDRWAPACWVDAEETICGVDTNMLPGGDSSATTPSCVAQDVPGKNSDYCGAFFDQTDAIERDPGTKQIVRDGAGKPAMVAAFVDGALTVTFGGIPLRFEGCCLPSGECGALLTTPRPLPSPEGALALMAFDQQTRFDLHLGCTSVTELAKRLADPAAEPAPRELVTNLPFCDPAREDAGYPTEGKKIPGQPEIVCGCGEGKTGTTCIPNTAQTVCGTGEVEAQSPLLATLPEFACGCGDEVAFSGRGLPCLSYVPTSICGGKAISAESAELAAVPEFVCGCEGSPIVSPAEGPCLKNVEAVVCGTAEVAARNPLLAPFPKYVCGCGEGVRVTAAGSFCLSNVASNVCGGLEILVDTTVEPNCLLGVPEYAHGCSPGATRSEADPSCIPYTPGLWGCVDQTTAIRRMPEVLCGCGEGVGGAARAGFDSNGMPCLPNVASELCGAVPVTSRAQVAALMPTLPNAVCGCGDGVLHSAPARPCLSNAPAQVCGPLGACTGSLGTQGSCAQGALCMDLFGGDTQGHGDGIADYCAPVPPT